MSFSNSLLLRRFEDLVSPDEGPIAERVNSRGTIVLAEADPSELEHIGSILRNLDFNVLPAGDGDTALKLARTHTPQLVLSSLELPKIDGYKLCQALREGKETEAIPFMFIVGDGEFPDHLIGHESYAHDYIQKPISVPEFTSRVQSLLNLVSRDDSSVDLKSVPEESVDLNPANPEGETHAPALEICRRIKGLLAEVASCLEELESLVGVEVTRQETQENEGVQSAEVSQIAEMPEEKAEEKNEIENSSQVEEYLAEYRTRLGSSGPLLPGEEVSGGVEDLFTEFFELESALRGAVGEPVLEGPDLEEVEHGTDDRLYDYAVAYVLESIRGVVSGEPVDIFSGADLAEAIVASLRESSALLLEATQRDQDYSVSRHSVNVAIFAARVAQSMDRNLQNQREVCLAGLLHELGVATLPEGLIHRKEPLTPEELRLIRHRPVQSGRVIESLGREYVWLAEIARQVTERENGTGGPLGLGAEEIDHRAKIIGIADVFDAYIHSRPYRGPVSGYQALFELTTDQQRAFSDQLVKGLIRSFSLYPLNECVRLNTGEIGKVVEINPDNLSRPVVTVFFDSEGNELNTPKTVDLGRESALYISEALAGQFCPALKRP